MTNLITSASFMFCLCIASTSSASVVDGGFDNGLDEWVVETCAFQCDRTQTPFLDIVTDGANSYLGIGTSPSGIGIIQESATQSVDITEAHSILTFDAISFGTSNDPTSAGGDIFSDALSVVIQTSAFDFDFLFEITNSGSVIDPFSNPAISVSQTAPSDSFFDLGVRSDLSNFIGQTVTLGIFAFSAGDGTLLSGGFDNFELSGPDVPVVPLPGGLPLMLGGLLAFGLVRRAKT